MIRFHFLDGLRGIAALLIVFHHSITGFIVKGLNQLDLPFLSMLLTSFTQSGVELFFVLSGVVLLRPYYRDDRAFDWKVYYVRRFKRIYPTYFAAVCFASLVIYLNTFYPNWYSSILPNFTYQRFAKQFFMFNQKWDYFNLAWWSLQIEIFFYLLIPLILLLRKNLGFRIDERYKIYLVIAVSILLQHAFSYWFPGFYSLDRRFSNLYRIVDYIPAFYFGIMIAKKDVSVPQSFWLMLLGMAMVFSEFLYLPFANMGYALIYGSLISLLFHFHELRKPLENWFMLWIGERSYSLFLIHFSVFYLTNYLLAYITADRNIIYGVLSRGLGIPLAIFASMLLFSFIEKRYARGLVTAKNFLPSRPINPK